MYHIKIAILWKKVLTEINSKAESAQQGRSINTAMNYHTFVKTN